jgi:periplasmic protein CpxP/Spy
LMVGLALTLSAAVAVAQTPAHGHMHGRGMEMLPFHAVGLTDAQRTQIKQLYQNAKPTLQPLFQQAGQNHQAMVQLITGGTFDQAKAQALATQAAQIHSQIEVQHAAIAAQAYQLLTPEQKTKMNEVIAEHQQRMEQRMQQNQQSGTPAENQ